MSLLGWKDLPAGDVLEGGTAEKFHTGDWRTRKPLVDKKTCINCLFCYMACPDCAIQVKDGKMEGFNYDFCKGCMICMTVCPTKPVKAISMSKER